LKIAQDQATSVGVDPKTVKAYTRYGHNFMSDWNASEKKQLLGFNFKALQQEASKIKLSKADKLTGKQLAANSEVMIDLQ
jgi:hypothetical protein